MGIAVGDSVSYKNFSWNVVKKEGGECVLVGDKCFAESQFYYNPLTFKDHWTAADYAADSRVSSAWEDSEIPKVLEKLGLENASLLTREEYEKWKEKIPKISADWWLKDCAGKKSAFVVTKDGSVKEVSVGTWYYGVRPVVLVEASIIEEERKQAEEERKRKEEESRREAERRQKLAEERKRAMELYLIGQGEFGIGESPKAGKVVFFANRHWVILGERKDSFLCLSYEAILHCPFSQREWLEEDGWSDSAVQQLCWSFVDVPLSKVMLDNPDGIQFQSQEKCFLLSRSLYERFQRVIPKTCGVWWLSTSSLRGKGEQLCVDDRKDGAVLYASCEKELGLRVACFIPKEQASFGWNATFLESFKEGDCYILNEVILCEGSRFALGVPSEGGGLQEAMLKWSAREFGRKAKVANMTTWQYERYRSKITEVGKPWLLLDYVEGYLTYVKAVGGSGEEEYGLRPMIIVLKKRR